MSMINNTFKKLTYKNWLYVSLAAAALTLGACADKKPVATEDEVNVDAQTSVEQEATGVSNADTINDPMASDGVAVASGDMTNDDVAVATAEDDSAAGIDDSDILDGSESEEHISTY